MFLLIAKIIKLLLPGDFTFVDLQSPLGHVSHPLLALLARVHGQVVDVRRLLRHLEVADAAVALRKGAQRQTPSSTKAEHDLYRGTSRTFPHR